MSPIIIVGERFGERMNRRVGLILGLFIVGGASAVFGATPSAASQERSADLTAAVQAAVSSGTMIHPNVIATDNKTCFACHKGKRLTYELPSGESVSATIDEDKWLASEHGHQDMACIQCHTGISQYPHETGISTDLRSFVLNESKVCVRCHEEQATMVADSVHTKLLAEGNKNAATCSDCHDPHYAVNPPVSRTDVPATCRECHSAIYDLYEQSAHGEALTTGNPDVPTCTDCHGVHEIQGPDNSPFRLFSPEICASCHGDKDLMAKYGISTDVFNTYVSDFHGTTVLLFEKYAPDQQTDKPVCIDCHGVHDIIPPEDPRSSVFEGNLLATCQRCHPDADANFPTGGSGTMNPILTSGPSCTT